MFKGKKIYTIIPARGGSKSLPRKNILPLNGKPLISYTIEYSLKSRIVDRTIVSTDDEEIAEISKKYGAEVPFLRPKKYARDTTQDFSVYNHALRWIIKNEKEIPDIIVLLRPTSPLRPQGLIEKGVKLLIENKGDSVRSVALCSENPFRMWKLKGDIMKSIIEHVKETYNIPRQKLPKIYFQTGDIEIMTPNTLLKQKSVSGKRIVPLIIEKNDMIDIDTKKDFELANKKLK